MFLIQEAIIIPPKCKFTRDEVVAAALDITRHQGTQAVTARAVGARLNSSPKVIFSLFENMEELNREVLSSAHQLYLDYISNAMAAGDYPPYKASGMAYIRFATEEKELFKLLFMRDRSGQEIGDNSEEIQPFIDILCKNLNISQEEARLLHFEMWLFVHGIATMQATSYENWDTELISRALTDSYMGLKHRFQHREED
jgi:AcrR family transcriptional regulator